VKSSLFGDGRYSFKRMPADISPVVEAYEHALLASYPRPRYLVGPGAGFMGVLAMLPETISDWMVMGD